MWVGGGVHLSRWIDGKPKINCFVYKNENRKFWILNQIDRWVDRWVNGLIGGQGKTYFTGMLRSDLKH